MPDNRTSVLNEGHYCPGIPDDGNDRLRIRLACRRLVQQRRWIPPMELEELKKHAATLLEQASLNAAFLPFTVVMLNNELWRPTVERTPFAKRLLLIPQCLRHSADCPAQVDSLGLLCKHCGRCVIDRFTRRAEELGYAVLVAEGSPVVMALIESGQVQATIGVSCLSVLERVYPYMEAGAVPGIAVPLLVDGCKDTVFDQDWLAEAIEAIDDEQAGPVDLTHLRRTVQEWFDTEALRMIFNVTDGPAAVMSLDWMAEEGKRYRPMLTAGIYATLTGAAVEHIPAVVRQAAIAIECFHKASLIHDDIEDNDTTRYDQPALHAKFGIGAALNAGDYLLGLGYQLLTELDCSDPQKSRILQIAAQGHRILCVGQGKELECVWSGTLPSVEKLLEIFSQKTSPAFAVALKVGAVLAGADDAVLGALDGYSDAIGIAYQIRDDLNDRLNSRTEQSLSILAAIGRETPCDAVEKAEILLEDYRSRAVTCLSQMTQSDCKSFLRKVVTKLLDGAQPMGCCDEYSPKTD